MAQPFRFGAQLWDLPADGWIERVRHVEALGYSTLMCSDHLVPQWESTAAIAAFAAVTERLHVASFVFDVNLRHPVLLAQTAATLDLISGGRFELGIGAGWAKQEYAAAGMPFDPPGARVERLEEALEVLAALWQNPTTTFQGKYYHLQNLARPLPQPVGKRPPLLVGGGSPHVLAVAGRWADTVSVIPAMPSGGWVWAAMAADSTRERIVQKIAWARDAAVAAGRAPEAIEWNTCIERLAIAPDPGPLREALARDTGLTAEQIAQSYFFLTGTPAEARDVLQRRRDESGVSYFVVFDWSAQQLEAFAEAVVSPLASR
jgi:probable F420-dependent oxidoreductase